MPHFLLYDSAKLNVWWVRSPLSLPPFNETTLSLPLSCFPVKLSVLKCKFWKRNTHLHSFAPSSIFRHYNRLSSRLSGCCLPSIWRRKRGEAIRGECAYWQAWDRWGKNLAQIDQKSNLWKWVTNMLHILEIFVISNLCLRAGRIFSHS